MRHRRRRLCAGLTLRRILYAEERKLIYDFIRTLTARALARGILSPEDKIYAVNRLFALLKLPGDAAAFPSEEDVAAAASGPDQLESILRGILDYAAENGLLEADSTAYRDLLDTEVMACLTPPPSAVNRQFAALYSGESPKAATDWFYAFSRATDYIRDYRIARDVKWTTDTEFGRLDITINLSKPEKDPRAIAAAKTMKTAAYPKCQLCVENEGYAGRLDHPARGNHRIIPIKILGEPWGFQYSPYVYYNEHCIVLNQAHVPMVIDKAVFAKLFDFVRQFPHYTVGSNADLPIVGGSILAHEHFQGGNYEFPMARAQVERPFRMKAFPDVEAGTLKWPMSVIRISGPEPERLTEAAAWILEHWRAYSDESAFIFAETDGVPHNTITPIARRREGRFELDLALRNNITTEEHPLGVFHPHAGLHHIKKENIGLIEVMGLAILPSRLKGELDALAAGILESRDLYADEKTAAHADWAQTFAARCTPENVHGVIQQETGLVFRQVLCDAGVFKRDAAGTAAFTRFTDTL